MAGAELAVTTCKNSRHILNTLNVFLFGGSWFRLTPNPLLTSPSAHLILIIWPFVFSGLDMSFSVQTEHPMHKVHEKRPNGPTVHWKSYHHLAEIACLQTGWWAGEGWHVASAGRAATAQGGVSRGVNLVKIRCLVYIEPRWKELGRIKCSGFWKP